MNNFRRKCFEEVVRPVFVEPHLQYGREVYRQAGQKLRDCTLHVHKWIASFHMEKAESSVTFAR